MPLCSTVDEISARISAAREHPSSHSQIFLWELISIIDTLLHYACRSAEDRTRDTHRSREADLATIVANGGFKDPRMFMLVHLLIEEDGDALFSDRGLARIVEFMQQPARV